MWIEIENRFARADLEHVTSLAEVWIEIHASKSHCMIFVVTSLAEVWIEIEREQGDYLADQSLPLRKCGLKFVTSDDFINRV